MSWPSVKQSAEGLFPRFTQPEGVVTVQPPSNYDDPSLQIIVDPTGMFSHVSDLQFEANLVMDAINAIDGIWNNLKLGWVGTTASEAQDFNNQWLAAIQALFGTTADPDSGAFSKVIDAVATASINYGEAEDGNQKMFEALTSSLKSSSSNEPPPSRSDTQGPITEIAPPPS